MRYKLPYISPKCTFSLLLASLLLFIFLVWFFTPNRGMSPAYSTIYFSGAANTNWFGNWQFAPIHSDYLKQLTGYEIYTYHFNATQEELKINQLNFSGYLWVVKFAYNIFPFLGPIGATVLLQVAAHLLTSFLLIKLFANYYSKILFGFGYFANPVIVYFVIFPYYYFWQFLPSFLFILSYFYQKQKINRPLFFGTILHFISFLIRPTTLLISIFTFCYNSYLKQSIKWFIVGIIFILSIVIWNNYSSKTLGFGPWHTAFVGLGAYPNNYSFLFNLSDERGYDRFFELTGKQVEAGVDGNNQNDLSFRSEYFRILKNEYLRILKNSPIVVIRNAGINFLQGYSIGYLNKSPYYLNLISALLGAIFIAFLIYSQEWVGIMAIGISHLTFSLYFPPIQAYMFGRYSGSK